MLVGKLSREAIMHTRAAGLSDSPKSILLSGVCSVTRHTYARRSLCLRQALALWATTHVVRGYECFVSIPDSTDFHHQGSVESGINSGRFQPQAPCLVRAWLAALNHMFSYQRKFILRRNMTDISIKPTPLYSPSSLPSNEADSTCPSDIVVHVRLFDKVIKSSADAHFEQCASAEE